MPESFKMLSLHVIFTTTLSTLIPSVRIKTALPVPLIFSTHPLQGKQVKLCKENMSYSHNPESIFPHKSYETHDHRAEFESPLLHEISLSTPHTH